LHWRLAREGGLDDRPSEDLRPSWDKAGIHGVARPRRWDAVVAAQAPDVQGDRVEFAALPDGTLVVEEEQGKGNLGALAEALETQLDPPYRAEGVRQNDDVWAVAGRRIEVLELAAEGEEIELTEHGGERALVVDGAQVFGTIPELETAGRRQGEAYVVRARRLDGDLWELQTDPL
jgi:hypothetical protein